MNPWQMAQQIKHMLQAVVWEDGSGAVVFGSRGVVVFAGSPPSEDAVPPGFPFALVTIGAGTMDVDHPELIEQRLAVAIVAEVAGDPLGEHAVIGGPRPDLGRSAGAGVAEVTARVRAAIESLTGFDGAKIILSASETGAARPLGRARHVALDELTLQALCTSAPHYAPPQQLQVSGSAWTWQGPHCSERFDWLQYRLGHVAGASPPLTPGAATIVYTGTTAAATHTPVAGRAYSVFADYDPRGTGFVAHSSDGSRVGAFRLT